MVENEEFDGSSGRTNEHTISIIEQKFQHFLNATVRAGSLYGACNGAENGTWGRAGEGHWVVRRRPQIRFGCVCLATSFIVYWYNYNGNYRKGWAAGIGENIHDVFSETIAQHRATIGRTTYSDFRGFQELVQDGSVQGFYHGSYYVSRIGEMVDFINSGALLFTKKVGNRYHFKWNPSTFNDFNVLGIGSHHVIIYVKRGSGGENDIPGEENTPHQIWRLAADSPDGKKTTWREEEVQVRICPRSDLHRRHTATTVENIFLSHDSQETDAETVLGWLGGKHVTLPTEVPSERVKWLSACESITAIWKLKDLRPNAQVISLEGYADGDALLDNPSQRIEIVAQSGASFEVSLPELTGITVMKRVGGLWETVQADGTLSAGDQVKLVIDSTGVEAGTQVSIGIFDVDLDEKLPERGEIQGNSTEIEFELLGFIVPASPDNKFFFRAWIYDIDFNVESGWIYLAS